MRRIAATAVLALALVVPGFCGQESGEKAANEVTAGEEGGRMELLAWLNFAMLMAGLVWIFRKNAVPYFASRALKIRKGMIEADDAHAEAERRMAEVEALLARLPADVKTLKEEAMREAEAEHERARRETAAELGKIRLRAEQEIEAAGKSARLELKRYTAELALGIAEQKIRARMSAAAEDALFRGFLRNLDGAARAQSS